MWYRRLLWAAALTAALLFQITNDNYLGRFLLALCVSLPLLSLALSLPGMLRCRLTLSAAPAAIDRGEKAEWAVEIDTAVSLPIARLTLRLTEENLLTGERQRGKIQLTGVARRRPAQAEALTDHCGLLELRAEKARVWDCLGLFTLRLPNPAPARLLCRPVPAPAEAPRIPEGLGQRPVGHNAARRGPGEDCDLREYRPGDPMRAVHWKLSSKWDELIVKERAETVAPLPLLTLDRFGTPEALDALLDETAGMSRALLTVQRSHAVLWLDGAGEPQLHPVADEREYAVMLTALLTGPAGEKGPALDDHPDCLRGPDGPVFRFHLTAGEGGDVHA